MISDTDRRAVARRLRDMRLDPWDDAACEIALCADIACCNSECHGSNETPECMMALCDRLADLIEPDHVGDSNKMVDRDVTMTADEARGFVTEARRALDRAMRALSVPGPDWGAAMRAARDCAEVCQALEFWCLVKEFGGRGTK